MLATVRRAARISLAWSSTSTVRAVSVVLVIAAAVAALGIMLGAEAGNLAEWAAAIGTVAAFVVTYRGLRNAWTREAQMDARERAKYAEQVAAWCEIVEHEQFVFWEVKLMVLNGGPQPIRHVRVRLSGHGDDAWTLERKVIPPGAELVEPTDANAAHPVPDVVHLEFTDAAGLQWCRPASGELLEVTPDPGPTPRRPLRQRLAGQ